MVKATVLVRYYGRVQGVGFRATARGIAQNFPLKGWVKNEPDGSVQLIASGEAADLDAFLEAIRRSHLGPKIDREVQERGPFRDDLKGFDIQY